MTTSIVQGFINSIPDKRIARAFSEIFARISPSKLDTAITAHAGGTKSAALALKSTCSFHDVTTVATAADSILLPPAKEGEFHFVKNSAASNAMQVFGQGTDTIDSVATGTGVAQLAGDGVMYYCLVPGNWLRIGGVSATEVFTTITATTVNATNIDAGASGTAGTVDVFPATTARGKLILAAVNNDADTNVTISNAAMGQATVISFPDPGASTANVLLTSAANDQAVVTATSAELNYNDITTLGTGAASKAVVLDAGEDYTWPDTGVLTIGVLATASEAAEHGAGAIGTAAVPTTKRWIERGGIIVTQTTFDLTGLASGGTANDIVGLAAGGAAYIGRNVVATNGVIFKMELSCLETPATGDGDIDIVADTSAALIGDGTYTGAIKINGGTLVVGQTVQNLVPAVDANFYFYIAAVGAGGGTYTAGQFVLTTYGHAVLA